MNKSDSNPAAHVFANTLNCECLNKSDNIDVATGTEQKSSVCVCVCSSDINRPAVCPPLRPLSHPSPSFILSPPPLPLSSRGNSLCVVSVRRMFVLLLTCLLHSSWM